MILYVNFVLGNFTNGVHAELIRSDSGLLLGIRVSWSWLSGDPIQCFKSPKVLLSTSFGIAIERPLDSISRNNSVEFNINDLHCNTMYLPTVRATLDSTERFENGNNIFFGGICHYVIDYMSIFPDLDS